MKHFKIVFLFFYVCIEMKFYHFHDKNASKHRKNLTQQIGCPGHSPETAKLLHTDNPKQGLEWIYALSMHGWFDQSDVLLQLSLLLNSEFEVS